MQLIWGFRSGSASTLSFHGNQPSMEALVWQKLITLWLDRHRIGADEDRDAVALVGSYELLMTVIRSSQAEPDGASGCAGTPTPDPLQG